MNINIKRGFQICISVPLTHVKKIYFQEGFKYLKNFSFVKENVVYTSKIKSSSENHDIKV